MLLSKQPYFQISEEWRLPFTENVGLTWVSLITVGVTNIWWKLLFMLLFSNQRWGCKCWEARNFWDVSGLGERGRRWGQIRVSQRKRTWKYLLQINRFAIICCKIFWRWVNRFEEYTLVVVEDKRLGEMPIFGYFEQFFSLNLKL